MKILQLAAMQIRTFLYGVITGRRMGLASAVIRGVLTPLSWLYSVAVRVRNGLYSSGILTMKCLPCPVISVGNVVAGGTGKTPTAIWIAKHLQAEGYRVGILLRGYHRQSRTAMTVVSDGNQICGSIEESGDEAIMIARTVPGCIVIVSKDRYAAGCAAIQMWGESPGILILDDGFQHRRLKRDLDIITVDSTQPFGTGTLLPAGTLREPRSALKRADTVLLTRTQRQDPTFQRTKPSAPKSSVLEGIVDEQKIYESRHRPTTLFELESKHLAPLDRLRGQRVLAVCGIGAPGAFAETLRQHDAQQVTLLAFPDHHHYCSEDFRQIRTRADEIGADLIVTTEKDAQQMTGFEGLQFFVLAVTLEITKNQMGFSERLMQTIHLPT